MTLRRGGRTARYRGSLLLAGLVLLLGAGVSWVGASGVAAEQDRRATRDMDGSATAVRAAVAAQADEYTGAARDVAAGLGALPRLTSAGFNAVVTAVDRARLPGGSAVGFVVPARDGEVAAVQRYWRDRGSAGLRLRPDPARTEHLFGVFARSLDGIAPVPGGDIAVAAEPSAALQAARDTGRPTASATYVLLKDRRAGGPQQNSFVVAAPVYAAAGTPAAGGFLGWVVLGIRGTAFLTETVRSAAREGLDVTVYDGPGGAGGPVLARWSGGGRPIADPRLARQVTVTVGQHPWRLALAPTTAQFSGTDTNLGSLVLAAGGGFALLLAALVLALSTAHRRAVLRVARATADLQADIEIRKRTEAQLREREAELESFAGVVAHDLKSPLASVAGYAELLADELARPAGPDAARFLGRITDGAARMRQLIDDLLAYATARDAQLHIQPVPLGDLVAEIAIERTAHLTDTRPVIEVGPLPVVDGDPVLLRHLLDNLIGNACKYVRHGDVPFVSVTGVEDGAGWRVEVADRGIGITPEQRALIFNAFQRARGSEGYPGAGLGLAICQRVASRHHGGIGVADNPGGGTVFWFTLPRVRSAATPELVGSSRGT